ncbi:MAG: DUF1294 domain-containing protein [Methanomassiliicoccaceae archaeon]|nr:DUF1294 domain-containing protein [Methanomassiliicoccaceae archaeon]
MNSDTIALVAAIYLVLNAVSLLLYYLDKKKAQKGRYRISEATLIIIGFLGPFGALAGMKIFRHKTQKTKFKLIYLFLILHLVLLVLILWKFLL